MNTLSRNAWIRALILLIGVVLVLFGLLFQESIVRFFSTTKEVTVPFTELARGSVSSVEQRENYVLDSNVAWEDFWRTVYPAGEAPQEPVVDFSRAQVLAVFLGTRPTGGYQVSVTKVVDTGEVIRVYLSEEEPGVGCVVTQAETSPYVIIEIPRVNQRIESESVRTIVSCEE